MKKLGDKYPSIIELASWLVKVLSDLKLHDIKKIQSPLNTPWKSILLIYFQFLVKALPPSFCYSLGIFVFFLLSQNIILSQNWWEDQFQYLSYQKKCLTPSSRIISVVMFYLFWILWSILQKLNFHFWLCLYCYCKIKSKFYSNIFHLCENYTTDHNKWQGKRK